MNQILQVIETKKHLKPIGAEKIFIFFLLAIILLGIGVGGYYIYINISNGNIKLPIFVQVPEETATITLTKTDRNKLVINVESETGIDKITYTLNNGESQVIDLTGETIIEETISMIDGENTISISVLDVEGKETTKQQVFVVEPPKPVIELSVVGNDIKITVTSEIELEEITYNWNLDNVKKENMATYENRLSFEKQLEIPIGHNTLTIVATDINGGITEKVQEIKGVTKATTTTEVVGEYLHFTVKGKENIEKVEFEFNGQRFLMNTETFGQTKKVHYKVKLVEGKNYLTITSTTQSGGVDVTSWEEEYKK